MTKEEFTEKFCIDGKWQTITLNHEDYMTPSGKFSDFYCDEMFIDTDGHRWSYTHEWELYKGPVPVKNLDEVVKLIDETFAKKSLTTDEESSEVSLNYNEGKPKPSLILKDMQRSFLEVLKQREYGCKKYSRDNLFKSIGTEHEEAFLEDNLDSIQRHLNEAYAGVKIDSESNTYHLAAIALRAMIGLEYELRKD